MKHRSATLLSVLLVLCLLMPVWAFGEAAGDTVEILFLGTSDIHGQLYATNYTADVSQSGQYGQGLTRVATYVEEQRAQYENVFLGDCGDLVQGTPLTYYYAFYQPDAQDPAMKALRMMDYDLFVTGNHEYNYGMDILSRQLADLTAPAAGGEDEVWVSMADYLDAATNSDETKDWATWNGYDPYRVFDYGGVKVAVMGIGNPNVSKWDVPANWEGIYFANVIDTYLHYEEEMDEASDLIVIYSHSGIDSDAESDFIRRLVEQTGTIDLVFAGHEHFDTVTEIADAAGDAVPVVSPGTKCAMIGQALVTYDKADGDFTIEAETVDMEGYAVDEALEAALKPYEEAAWDEYMLQPIGTATGDFPAAGLGTAPSAFMDLINRVQIWGAYDNTGENTPDDPTDDTPAQLSISAPLTSGDAENLIPEGEIVLGDMFGLYRYENWFYQITMSGKELRAWLEFAATKIQVDENGPFVSAEDLTYYDVIYGDGFSYVLDYSAAPGSRVASMTYEGEEVADGDTFTVVVNNYRYNGGGNYIAYLNAHGCSFTPNDPERIIYSTQYDMMQGEDMGQARNLLANYITLAGTIDPEISSDWSLEDLGTLQLAVLSTTDMHGRATLLDVATQTEDAASMERVASAVLQEREAFGDKVLLVDNGDTIQGTLVAQYAINLKPDEENPMITALDYIGYDAWVMGNHEFNFTPDRRDAQTRIADEAGIAVISGNIVLVEDGVDFRGEEKAAGDPFYDPYVIKTYDFGDGRTVRVAVIGLSNAANHTWDLATNYPNMQFSSLDNPDGLLAFEINKWASEIRDNDLADIVIVSVHSGKGTDDGVETDGFLLESQVVSGVQGSHGVDLVIYGHDHTANIETLTDADGKAVPIVNGGGTHVTKTVFDLTFDEDGAFAGFTIRQNANLALASYAGDETLAKALQPWYDDTYAWASEPLGTFDKGWSDLTAEAEGKTNDDMVLSQTHLLDFVHKGQIWCSWQSFESEGIEGATVSIASPVFGKGADDTLSFVPKDGDTISTLELSKLYRYSNNLLCAIDMTPQQLYNWMSAVADMLVIGEDGLPALGPDVSIYGVDSFYGIDYTFDLTKPLGERVTAASIDGTNLLEMGGPIRVTLNSYRLSGGYGFLEATGLTEADCCWTASQYLGADRAPVPTQLGEYVAHMGTVTPDDPVSHGFDTTWQIVTE